MASAIVQNARIGCPRPSLSHKNRGIRIKRYLDETRGVPLNDVWIDIPPINSRAKERMGYATQKPLALLDDRRFKTPTVHGRREAKPVLPGINP